MRDATGFSAAETALVLALVGLSLAAALPALAERRRAALAAAGARHVAVALAALRWNSAARGTSHGLSFARDERGWLWSEVRDGNGNGLRTGELASGIDRTIRGPLRLEDAVSGITLGFPPGGPFPRVPPGTGPIDDLDDPVQIGATDLLSFSPLGTATGGTIYVTDSRARLFAVVVLGASGRVRVWRYDAARGAWSL
jgi:hypothetical protein